MVLHDIIERRRTALLNAWQANSLFQIQTRSLAELGSYAFVGADDLDDGNVGPLGRRDRRDVAIAVRPGPPDVGASVWVARGYDNYRRAYLAFIRQTYGLRVQHSDLAGYDADHLLNRARSPSDATFIRLEAVASDINQAWGRLFEKAASAPEFFANTQRQDRKMSWMVASKLANQWPPAGPHDTAGIDRLVRFWTGRGFPDEQTRHGVTDELRFVFRLPRGEVVTPTVRWI